LAAYSSTRVGTDKSERAKRKRTAGDEKQIVELSAEARLVSRSREVLDQTPDIRPEVEELIAEIQKKLADGSYIEEISGQKVVEAIKAALKEEAEELQAEIPGSDQLSLDP
ncbi:MAG: flagellar biosynthesis anti-sigma factor FlgM, partial [Candidatus Poribacteria bacterium]|nr:flagellar biosynthesis anti-sigma factor FlgM [Candidatus Poribacteria bacterium]